MYFAEDFDAKLFLSHIHQDTPAADLESGALVLKTDLKGRTQQKKQLVKENFDCFVSCKTTIDGILLVLTNVDYLFINISVYIFYRNLADLVFMSGPHFLHIHSSLYLCYFLFFLYSQGLLIAHHLWVAILAASVLLQ